MIDMIRNTIPPITIKTMAVVPRTAVVIFIFPIVKSS
jgi:hypothetical protein